MKNFFLKKIDLDKVRSSKYLESRRRKTNEQIPVNVHLHRNKKVSAPPHTHMFIINIFTIFTTFTTFTTLLYTYIYYYLLFTILLYIYYHLHIYYTTLYTLLFTNPSHVTTRSVVGAQRFRLWKCNRRWCTNSCSIRYKR